MDFYTHQDIAKSRTFWLIFLYLLIIILISIFSIVMFELIYFFVLQEELWNSSTSFADQFFSPVYLLFLAVVAFIVFSASTYRYSSLKGGGQSVVEIFKAKPVLPQSRDLSSQKILNVVEEMAIASGVPVPPVYIMDSENSINAFAAGYSINDAVIGVTKGAVEKLDRDELQAVIAHEFSHILNGDMRLNMRLAALTFGLFFLVDFGLRCIDLVSRLRSDKDGAKLKIGIIAACAVIIIAGAIGALFGKIFQAAVSRQREYLADASSVQFTRSKALASALKKVQLAAEGSKISLAGISSFNHFFFCNPAGSLFASHPPLKTRIGRIESDWNVDFSAADLEKSPQVSSSEATQKVSANTMPGANNVTAKTITNLTPLAPGFAALPENKQSEHITAKLQQLEQAPREPLDACSLMYAMLLDKKADMEKQLLLCPDRDSVFSFAQLLQSTEFKDYVLLVEKSVPTLKLLSAEQYAVFISNLEKICETGEFNPDKWIIYQLIKHQVSVQYEPRVNRPARYTRLNSISDALACLLHAIAVQTEGESADAAFRSGLAKVGLDTMTLHPVLSLAAINKSLDILQQSSEALRKSFLQGALQIAAFDKRIVPSEAVFLHVISLCLDCPLAIFQPALKN